MRGPAGVKPEIPCKPPIGPVCEAIKVLTAVLNAVVARAAVVPVPEIKVATVVFLAIYVYDFNIQI
jgi:hypothetical protein